MDKIKFKPELYFKLADRWFRLIEFSLILATLNYFNHKTGSNILKYTYWISWFMFYNWFLELAEFIADKIYKGESFSKKILIGILATIPFSVIFVLLSRVSEILIMLEK